MIAIWESKQAGLLSKAHIFNNIISGVVVGIVALPLGMAFAIASGAKPEQGIYTAIIAGAISALFGGSRVQISGPTGAFIVILAGITSQYGIAGLQIATLMAGLMLIIMGVARFGNVIKYIPLPVIVGFTTGIAVLIWVGQWKDFFGLAPVAGAHFHEKLFALVQTIPSLDIETTLLATFTLCVLIVSPYYFKRVPAPLIGMIAATSLQYFYQFEGVETIGSAFGGIPQGLPHFELLPITFNEALKLVGPAFTIALLGAIESLLSAVVADSMTGTKHDSNQELIGQGLANICSPLFGGFASTGAIARTATNIKNGATSPLSGFVHAIMLILTVLILAPLANHIPLCSLAAILFVVAFNMSELHKFHYLMRTSPRSDIAVLVITFLLTVLTDLVLAVNIGILIASLLFIKRMGEAVNVVQEDRPISTSISESTIIFTIEGPFFFAAADKIFTIMNEAHQKADTLVLRFHLTPVIDATGIQTLWDILAYCKKHNMRLVLLEMRPNILEKIIKSGIYDKVGAENVLQEIKYLTEKNPKSSPYNTQNIH